jgi:hypothetical protein
LSFLLWLTLRTAARHNRLEDDQALSFNNQAAAWFLLIPPLLACRREQTMTLSTKTPTNRTDRNEPDSIPFSDAAPSECAPALPLIRPEAPVVADALFGNAAALPTLRAALGLPEARGDAARQQRGDDEGAHVPSGVQPERQVPPHRNGADALLRKALPRARRHPDSATHRPNRVRRILSWCILLGGVLLAGWIQWGFRPDPAPISASDGRGID